MQRLALFALIGFSLAAVTPSAQQQPGPGLGALSGLDKVEKLGLESCKGLDDSAIGELVKWKSLKYVDLQDTRVTADGVELLKKARPGITVLANPKSIK